jgi:hypothetical protein
VHLAGAGGSTHRARRPLTLRLLQSQAVLAWQCIYVEGWAKWWRAPPGGSLLGHNCAVHCRGTARAVERLNQGPPRARARGGPGGRAPGGPQRGATSPCSAAAAPGGWGGHAAQASRRCDDKTCPPQQAGPSCRQLARPGCGPAAPHQNLGRPGSCPAVSSGCSLCCPMRSWLPPPPLPRRRHRGHPPLSLVLGTCRPATCTVPGRSRLLGRTTEDLTHHL